MPELMLGAISQKHTVTKKRLYSDSNIWFKGELINSILHLVETNGEDCMQSPFVILVTTLCTDLQY
jgi:hypothetical protein